MMYTTLKYVLVYVDVNLWNLFYWPSVSIGYRPHHDHVRQLSQIRSAWN